MLIFIVGTGMDGVAKGAKLPPPRDTTLHDATTSKGCAHCVCSLLKQHSYMHSTLIIAGTDVRLLPTSLSEALECLEGDEVILAALGEPLVSMTL